MAQQIVEGSHPSALRKLLDAGADPMLPDRDGDTAIHYAAMDRNPAYLELFLARGLSPDTRNRVSGRTPIMSAMLAERDRQFTLLMAAGANLAQTDMTGNTPLHVAAQINKPRYVLTLLNAGAPAAARNAQGQTFQRYLFMTPGHLLNEETWRLRRAVATWLLQHDIALETDTP
ncbi:ankyrin repeat domain-containing protein [Sphingopyxis sp.]|uniref:ankyrin repeat domain-containing protein n=1 Tax=Sphingopyxis sp. TaxID=1908224 RepID=UPI003D14CB96